MIIPMELSEKSGPLGHHPEDIRVFVYERNGIGDWIVDIGGRHGHAILRVPAALLILVLHGKALAIQLLLLAL